MSVYSNVIYRICEHLYTEIFVNLIKIMLNNFYQKIIKFYGVILNKGS